MMKEGIAVCSGSSPSWKWHPIDVLSGTRGRRNRFERLYSSGNPHERQDQRQLDLFSSLFYGLTKESTRQASLVQSLKEKPVLSNQYKTIWVDQLPSVDTPLQSQLVAVQQSFCVRCSVAGDELMRVCKEGDLGRAFDLLLHMDEHRATPSVHMYRSLLKTCGRKKALAQAKRVHAHLAKQGLNYSRFLGEYVVITLVKCGGLKDALDVFQKLPHRTVHSWTSVISGLCTAGQGQEAIRVYYRMREEGLHPDKHTFISVLKACRGLSDLEEGERIHSEAVKYGYASDVFVGTCLVDMYAKCGSIEDAQNVFDWMPTRSVVTWTAMLAAYTQQGQAEKALHLYEQMCLEGISADDRTFVIVLQACGSLAEKEKGALVDGQFFKIQSLAKGMAVHFDAWRMGYDSDVFVGSTLISMYGKCGCIKGAQNVFCGLSQRNLVSWNAMLATSAQQGQPEKALQLYTQMQEEGVSPDNRTFVSVLQACAMLGEDVVLAGQSGKNKYLQKGKAIHAEALRKGYDTDVFVSSTLVSMYGKCGSVVDGQNIFNSLSEKSVVSCNAMLAAYIQEQKAEKALWLYEQMQEEGVPPDEWTFSSALQACGMLAEKENDIAVDVGYSKVKSLQRGKEVHAVACRKYLDSDLFVGNTLISMYGKCGSILDAQKVFHGLSPPDVVSWNVMLTAYAEQGEPEKALQLYRQMQEEGECPDEVTLLLMLQVCSNTGSLEVCRQMHQSLLCTRENLSPLLATTLIHAYGRCASMVEAQLVFDALSEHDVVSWNALIAGYSREGSYAASLLLYEDMQLAGVKPDGVTFLSLVSACSHAGLVEKGVEYVESMSRDYGIAPAIEHYVGMVDLLGRAGCFSRVEELLSKMPIEPNLAIWLCLLGACQKHGKVLLGKRAFNCAVHLHRHHASAYMLMSNIYSDAGLWKHAKDLHALMQKEVAWKKPGQSWIEHEEEVINFAAGDHTTRELSDSLVQIRLRLEAAYGLVTRGQYKS